MPLRPGSLRLPWQQPSADDDPYWDAFINRPPADDRNLMAAILKRAPEGAVFPTRTDLHTPEVTASHVKELAVYLRAESVGIVDLQSQDPELAQGYSFGIVCVVRAENDPYTHPGFGGQAPVQNGQYITFIVASWIREMGYRATMKLEVSREQRERLAVTAGLGTLNVAGRLTVPKLGTKIYVTDIIFTDLPMKADG